MRATLGILMFISVLIPVWCDSIEVDLESYSPSGKNVYKSFEKVSDRVVKIKLKHINNNVGFLILQIHTYLENVTLSYNSTPLQNKYVRGKNIGLVYGDTSNKATFYLIRHHPIGGNLEAFVVVTIYDEKDPVPGGCNLTFDSVIAPYQMVLANEDYISVYSQPPSAYGVSCNQNVIQVDMYHLYLTEYDNSNFSYFQGITNMLTVESIKQYGRKTVSSEGYFKYRKLYCNYRGTGQVFGIIATYKNKSSAYIPTASYGCDISIWEQDCIGPVSGSWKFICALFLIFGAMICFFGHRFFKLSIFIIGLLFGGFVTFVAITLGDGYSFEERLVTSGVLGVLCGFCWCLVWWRFGIPLISTQLTFLLSGVLVASAIFYVGLADLYDLHNDLNFWTAFFCVVMLVMIIFTTAPLYGHISGCALLGSYAVAAATNYYIGGNLQYIIINTYRRLAVKDFNSAVIDPPFQIIDCLQLVFWILLINSGIFIQWKYQQDKPPFPRNRNSPILATSFGERTMLIPPEDYSAVPRYVR